MVKRNTRDFWLMGLVFGVFLSPLTGSAQWATVSAGGTDTVGGLIISSSVGEWDVQTLELGSFQIQCGVQQPYRWPSVQTRLIGHLMYGNVLATPLEGTQVLLRQGNQLRASAFTDAGGHFDLGLVDTGTYQLIYQNPTPWRGVNSTDALGVLRHFTNGVLLHGLYRQAADVNARNTINALEAQTIARRTIRLLSQFAAGDWLYDRVGVSIPLQATPQNNPMVMPIVTLCYGDVNGSYTPGAPLRSGWFPLEPSGVMGVGAPDQPYDLPIYWVEGGSLGAITLEIQVPDGVEVLDVLPGEDRFSGRSLLYYQENNVLRVAWYGLDPWDIAPGGELLKLKLRGRPSSGWLYGAQSELADGWAQPISSFRLAMPQVASGALEVQVLPNPVGDEGRLWCSVPGAGRLSYTLLDAFGRLVWSGHAAVERHSVNEVELPVERMRQGAYHLQVNWHGTGQHAVKSIKIVK